ncbi:MAG: ATP-binding region ATPase domain protein [Actinomycetia bacterium]|nr:ATP-binding region ATPase domain protein [Actinomycetes bacterium]
MNPYAVNASVTARRPLVPPVSPPPPPGNAGWHEQFPRRSYVELAADLAAAPSARYRLRDDLAAWRLRIPGEDAELVTGELVANAVNATRAATWHGPRPPVRVWAIGGGDLLFVLVWDATVTPPAHAEPGTWDESGRGLQLVAALSHWGFYYPLGEQAGKVVWAQFPKAARHDGAFTA